MNFLNFLDKDKFKIFAYNAIEINKKIICLIF